MTDFRMDTSVVMDTADRISGLAEELDAGDGINTDDSCRSASVAQGALDAVGWFRMSATRSHGDVDAINLAARSAAQTQQIVDANVARGSAPRGSWLP
ncbi:hypothetical protein ACL9RL_16780 [Plantibacter sp. Mn2098]|uniref:hypothetical protein n=1 Tax=Plantibacter sp. Mn2098 TaxID=3395266 RepID=UPI003BBE843E